MAVDRGLSLSVASLAYSPLSKPYLRLGSLAFLNMTTYSQELCASVSGFPSNCYRCCENIEEGDQALRKFLAARAAETSPAPTTQTIPGPTRLEPSPTTATSTDDSWWCCFSGAEPGVYNGL